MNFKTKFYSALYLLWKLCYPIINFRKLRKFSGFNRKLKQALADQEVERIILKSKITRYMRKYLKVDARSKYIPKDNKSREESRQQVLGMFGEQMDKVGLIITHDLVLRARRNNLWQRLMLLTAN